MGDQIKQAFHKLKDFWNALSPKLKKLCIAGLVLILVLAIGLTVFLNLRKDRYTALFLNMEEQEAAEVYDIVKEMGVDVQMDNAGNVLVPTDQYDKLITELAMKHYPKSTLTYDIFNGSGGLTTTDFEKRELLKMQLQERMQGTLKNFSGVTNAIVTLNIAQDSTRVWENTTAKSSASVTLTLEPNMKLSPQQVSGVKWLVASSIPNMDVSDVKVIDAATSLPMKSEEDAAPDSLTATLERLDLERRIEERLVEKALNVLTVAFKPDEVRVSATVAIDYSKMLTESKMYQPSETSTNNSGVLQHFDSSDSVRTDTPAQGIPGEEDNTDLPTYVNQTTDGEQYRDSTTSQDYAVSYILQQIEKDRAELKTATIAVTLSAEVDDYTRQSLISSVSKATNIGEENISVESLLVEAVEEPIVTPPAGLTPVQMAIIGGGLLLFLLLLILILVIIGRARRKKKEEEILQTVQQEVIELGDEDTEFNLQKELEERKRQLLEGSAKTADDAIAEEVREFARSNPEITASLLRAWMKEEID